MAKADLDSPRRELSNGGLGIVVALLVRWQIDFLSVYTGGPIQLYKQILWRVVNDVLQPTMMESGSYRKIDGIPPF